jgi:hypothetical protein
MLLNVNIFKHGLIMMGRITTLNADSGKELLRRAPDDNTIGADTCWIIE